MNKIYSIAEIGINHNGDLNICKKLIDVACESGFNAVKFQKRDIELVYNKEQLDSYRESPWGTTTREQKYGLEFSKEDYDTIDDYCKEKKIDWFASAWDLNSLRFLDNYDLKFHKVASAMIIDKSLLEEIAERNLHTFISTGMSNYDMIDEAVNIFKNKNCSYELMHCISTYPMNDSDANLSTINSLKKRYNCNVGYSGHESGITISIAAAALGISSLERHITLDRTMYGSDQAASLEPDGARSLIKQIRKVEIAIGDGNKTILDEEKPIAEKLRSHINL